MVGSFSSGSSGPRPVISSTISRDELLELLRIDAPGARRALLADDLVISALISSFGSLSIADQVDLLDQPAMQAHLGVEQLVAVQRIARLRRGGAGAGSGSPEQLESPVCRGCTVSVIDGASSRSGNAAGAEAACHVVAPSAPPTSLPSIGKRDLPRLPAASGSDVLLQGERDLIARLDLIERNAAVDRFAHQRVVVRDRGDEIRQAPAQVGMAQARREHLAAEAVDHAPAA